MDGQYVILAFQREGENYDNASIFSVSSEAEADEKVEYLKRDGFVVFIVTKAIKRFDGYVKLQETILD